MFKKKLQRIAIISMVVAVFVIPALIFFASESGSEYAYEIPRMLSMGGQGDEVARLDGPPSDEISAPIFETHGKAHSFDKDLRELPQVGPKDKRPAREMGSPPNLVPNGNGVDAVTQGEVAASAPAPAPSNSFAGLDLNDWGAGWPPDTHGDVGPNHYIQAVNTSIGVFDKTSGSLLSAFTFNNFFVANGANDACATLNYGDPIVLYDQVSGRWIITDFAFAGSGSTPPYYECIAVSKSADPVSGGWWLYTVVADTASLNDYPKLGIWNDGIYMSANMFKRGRSYAGVKVWALNRDDLISGADLRSVAFTLGNTYFSLLPANARVDLPPAGTPAYFMSDYGSNTSMKLWEFHVDWDTPTNSTMTGPTSFAVSAFTRPSSRVPQLNSSEDLDSLGDRLMTWLQYTNINGTEALWVSRTVVSGTTFGIRWMEVRGMDSTPSVYQEGTYAPDANYRWMPSLAVNSNGDMAVGYSVSSASMYPAIRYAGRLASDPLGTLGQTEASLIEGTGSQSNGYNRWGDYSSMSVDPVDNCTFWFTTEYYVTTGNDWQTRIGSFKLADCGGVDPTPTPTDTPTATPTPTDTPTATPTPDPSGTMHVSAIDMWYSRAGANYIVYTKVTVVDESGAPVSGATVSISMVIPGGTATGSAVTASDGTVTFNYKSKNTGTYTSTVTDVSHDSFTYDAGANVETSESLPVP